MSDRYVKVCPSCSRPSPAASQTCSHCGHLIEFVVATSSGTPDTGQETPAYRICGECDGRNPVESRDHALNRCMYCGNTEIMSGRFVPKAAPAQPVLAESAPPVHKPLTLVELHQKHRIMVPPSGGTIGRHGDLDPQFFARCPHVSGTHCRLYVTQGEWYVRDLGSMNHTYINGNKLGTEATKLTAKSILQIADLKFDVEIS